MEHTKLVVEQRHERQLLHLKFNAPSANVLDGAMMAEISGALREHASSTKLKGVVFEGEGKHFSFGASVKEHQADHVFAMLTQFHDLFRLLGEISLPTFAVVRGQCLGGGLELASYCTWLFADSTAKFGQPEIKLAVFPPIASVLLPWRLGGAAAMDLCIAGRSIDAEYAHRIGLAHDVSDEPGRACDAFFTEHIRSLSASSLRFAERAARLSLLRAMERDLPELERLYVDELMKTHDANEGIASFLEKRKPVFTGESPNS